jgi:hypothetical protein
LIQEDDAGRTEPGKRDQLITTRRKEMSVIRCYLDAEQSLYEQFERHLAQHFEQELFIGSSRLYTFLVSLPDVQQGIETQYMRRIFLSSLPI